VGDQLVARDGARSAPSAKVADRKARGVREATDKFRNLRRHRRQRSAATKLRGTWASLRQRAQLRGRPGPAQVARLENLEAENGDVEKRS
jgi:hypothetical protein